MAGTLLFWWQLHEIFSIQSRQPFFPSYYCGKSSIFKFNTCRPTFKEDGKIYSSEADVKKGKNYILDAATDDTLYYKDKEDESIYHYEYDKIYTKVRDKVEKYTAVFEVENSKLIFKEMKK